MNISSNHIIIISGSSGIGKTTISKQILKQNPDFYIIEEWDFIREAIRANNTYLINTLTSDLSEQIGDIETKLKEITRFNILNRSTSELPLKDILEQSKLLIHPLIKICERIKNKNLSAIIEGVNLPIRLLVSAEETLEYFIKSENIILVNLYASNYEIYKERLNFRNNQRQQSTISNETFNNIMNYNEYNRELSTKAFEKTNILNDIIINIDVTSPRFSKSEKISNYILENLDY